MSLAWRIGLHLGMRILGHALLSAVLLALLAVSFGFLFGRPGFSIGPWSLVGPALTVGAIATVLRMRQTGETLALVTAAPGGTHWPPLLVLLAAVHLPFLAWGGDVGEVPVPDGVVHQNAAGDLLQVSAARNVLFTHTGELQVLPPSQSWADTFDPLPANPGRHRRLLFLAHGPLAPSGDGADPGLWRWLYVLWGVLAPLVVLMDHTGKWSWACLLPFALLVAVV